MNIFKFHLLQLTQIFHLSGIHIPWHGLSSIPTRHFTSYTQTIQSTGQWVSANRWQAAVLLPAQLASHWPIHRVPGMGKVAVTLMDSIKNQRLSNTMHLNKRCMSANNHQFMYINNKQNTKHIKNPLMATINYPYYSIKCNLVSALW